MPANGRRHDKTIPAILIFVFSLLTCFAPNIIPAIDIARGIKAEIADIKKTLKMKLPTDVISQQCALAGLSQLGLAKKIVPLITITASQIVDNSPKINDTKPKIFLVFSLFSIF